MASYPTVDEFKGILLREPLERVVEDYVFAGVPFVFKGCPGALKVLQDHLHKSLALPPENILVVGSAKIGFSLSPDTFPRGFSRRSDIDVVAIDKTAFDLVWMTILKWHYPRRYPGLEMVDRTWVRERKKDIYWGFLAPDRIRYTGLSLPETLKPLRNLSTKWFNAFRGLSLYPEFSPWNVSGRLYRTREHALLYHVQGLRQIRDKLV